MQTLHTDLSYAAIQSKVPQGNKCLNFIGECGGLVCTICHPCVMYISKSEWSSQHQNVLTLFSEMPLYIWFYFLSWYENFCSLWRLCNSDICTILQKPTNWPINKPTNQTGPWFAQICNERASNQAKIKIRYLLKLNLSIVITLTLVLNSNPDI